MPKYIGSKLLKARYVGTQAISKIYRGASLVWGAIKETLAQISGKSMTLVNCTREESLNDFKIYGKSEQTKYQGTNLAKIKSFNEQWTSTAQPYTIARDGWITLELLDTSVNKTFYMRYLTHNHPFSTVAREMDANGNFLRSTFLGLGNEVDADQTCYGSFTVGSDCKKLAINLFSNRQEWVVKVDESNLSELQINIGTVRKDYEPFVGGIPSPSPNYPQSIESVVEPVVTYSGKNLIGSITQRRIIDSVTGVESENDIGSVTDYIPLEYGETYTLSLKVIPNYNKNRFYDKDKNYLGYNTMSYWAFQNGVSTKSVTNKDVAFVRFEFDYNASYTYGMEDFAQFEKGSTATEYEPYHEPQSYTWNHTLYGIPVSSGGNYTDESGQQWIADYVDVANKKLWHIVEHTNLDTSQFLKSGSQTSSEEYVKFFTSGSVRKGVPNSNILSTHFVQGTRSEWSSLDVDKNLFAIDNEKEFLIKASSPAPKTLDLFKKWIINSGVMFLYQLYEPYSEDLTDAEIEAFLALKTFKPTTIVSNNYDAHMSTSYHTKLEELDAQLINLYNSDIKEITT